MFDSEPEFAARLGNTAEASERSHLLRPIVEDAAIQNFRFVHATLPAKLCGRFQSHAQRRWCPTILRHASKMGPRGGRKTCLCGLRSHWSSRTPYGRISCKNKIAEKL
jgi:hypothetical protein